MEAPSDFYPKNKKPPTNSARQQDTETARRQQEVDFPIASLNAGVQTAAPTIMSAGDLWKFGGSSGNANANGRPGSG